MAEVIEAISSTTQAAVFGFATSNYLMSLLFSNLIQLLWGVINTLQLIMLTVLFTVSMPINSHNIMIELLKITNLDMIDTNWILQKIMTLEETPPFSQTFGNAGYETTNFLLELGPLLFFMVASGIFVALRLLFGKLISMRCRNRSNCLASYFSKKTFVKATFVRFLLESCIEIGLTALICVCSVSRAPLSILSNPFSFHEYRSMDNLSTTLMKGFRLSLHLWHCLP